MTPTVATSTREGSESGVDLSALLGSCPLPMSNYDRVLLGHGSGGTLSSDLIRKVFIPALSGTNGGTQGSGFRVSGSVRGANGLDANREVLSRLEDSALLDVPDVLTGARLAFTTDSFVVRPIFFPGGDLGKLAIHGTVNDLAVSGATPLFVSAAFILEEGLPIADLKRIVASMRQACDEAGVALVCGDTKVVDRGKGDQVFITTSGIGISPSTQNLSIRNARPGDKVIVSGTIGDHGIAIMSVREGLEFETVLESDTAPLNGLAGAMLDACPSRGSHADSPGIRCMRDPTRGGISSALNELADASNVGIRLDEAAIPIKPEVRAACDMLGLDPLYVANEGKLIAVVPAREADDLLAVMRSHKLGRDAAIVGEIVDDHAGTVVLKTLVGGERVVTMITGEQLPRIC